MSSKWGREESYRWPSKKPVWTITALFVAALAMMATVFYVYAEDWTFLQQRYLGTYLSSLSPSRKANVYKMVFRVEGKQERLAVDADFSDPVVSAGKAKLQWERKNYLNADVERWLREVIYGGQKPWDLLFPMAWKMGAAVLVVGLFFAMPRDQKRRRVLKYGRRTKGPELVSAAEFNRRNQSDGIGFRTKERRTFEEFLWRREGQRVRIPRERESSHVMMMGDTGAGKSSLIRQILIEVEERGETAMRRRRSSRSPLVTIMPKSRPQRSTPRINPSGKEWNEAHSPRVSCETVRSKLLAITSRVRRQGSFLAFSISSTKVRANPL